MVDPVDADIRLDRWFKRHFPTLAHGRLEKLLRTGQIRLDGKRAEASVKVFPGQSIRVPPLDLPSSGAPLPPKPRSEEENRMVAQLKKLILHRDDDILVINKPSGLAVQGGTGTYEHLDGMLDELRFGHSERPRLVHRLDRDTSGVLVLARHPQAATRLAAAFRDRAMEKVYWAITVGVPTPRSGKIDKALAKAAGPSGRERVAVDAADAKRAVSLYRVIDSVAKQAALLELVPITGRTHQLRVHCAAIGTPILGDGKYGGAGAYLPGADVSNQLHLHARSLTLPRVGAPPLTLTAPPSAHFASACRWLGLDPTA
jgi:23S rRNA pseudouridine955/2504/2580 synthase